MERKHALELLDNNSIDPAELRGNLRDIAQLNHWTGNTTAILRAVDEFTACISRNGHQPPLSIIDIGTGAGDLTTALSRWAKHKRLPLHIIGADLHMGVLSYARQHGKASDWLRLDATCLPLSSASVDIAICTTMAHHLEPELLQCLFTEMRRVSRHGFILLDLERSQIAYMALWLLTHLISRNPLTRNDGPLSIQRAYTRAEIAAIAGSAGISLQVSPVFPFRWLATWHAS